MDQTRYKIVLVDDNISTLNQGKSLLKSFYKVYTVQSPSTLFKNLEDDVPDLILLDVEMPEMSGFDVIKKLKANARYKDIPVIFLTSKSDEESEREGFRLGAVDYIAKPFSGPLLQKRISNQILYMHVQTAVKNYSSNLEVMLDEIAKANERTKILLDKTPLCCRLWDSDFRIIDCNEAAVKLFGFKDKQEYMERYSELYPEYQPDGQLSHEKVVNCIEKAFTEGTHTFEWTYKMLDDTLMPAEIVLVRVEYEDGYAVAGYTRDLREQKAVLEEMRKAEIAEESSRAKSRFLANMSHEIRTPMNSIMGFAELALAKTSEPQVKDYLGKITDSTKWLLRIVNDILDISKIESGKIEFENVPFDLRDVIMRCQSVIMPGAKEKGLDLRFYVEPPTGKRLLGDPLRLYQALMNLLSNAVKFTNSGVVKLSSQFTGLEDEKVRVYFEVKDSGIGMDPEQVEKVFESFIQGDSSTTRNYGGTGLGLAITKNIVELMGGELLLDSSPGKGSTISFELVFETIAVSEETCDNLIFRELEKPQFDGLVLVCDDNLMNQEVICEHLANVGLKTMVAVNGKIGVEIVQERLKNNEKPFDLIFMDMFMPVMDGLETAAKIMELNTGAPIVAMTANVMSGEIENYKRQGMPDCLGKPFTSQELWRILLKYLTPSSNGQAQNSAADASGSHLSENELLMKLKLNFAKHNRTRFAEITEAIGAGDLKLAHRLAHSLKGNAGLIGKSALQKAAADVEVLLKDGRIPDTGQHMSLLEDELKTVLEELASLQSEQEQSAPLKQLNAGQVLLLFERLEFMLQNRNPESANLLADIRAVPGTEELALQVENYDFKPALLTLAGLKKKWMPGDAGE